MVLVGELSQVSDLVDANPDVQISVTSNQDINGTGDGNTDSDWQINKVGDSWEIWLRAERSGNKDERVYNITVTTTEMYGNSSTSTNQAVVPKSQGKK